MLLFVVVVAADVVVVAVIDRMFRIVHKRQRFVMWLHGIKNVILLNSNLSAVAVVSGRHVLYTRIKSF